MNTNNDELTTTRYLVYVEKGVHIKTPAPRYYINDGVYWYFSDLACSWTRCASGTVVPVDSDPDVIITSVGRAIADGEVTVPRSELPK